MTWPSEPAAIVPMSHTKDPSNALLDMDKIVKYYLEDPKDLKTSKASRCFLCLRQIQIRYPDYSKEIESQ
jgi:hypothetical protein